MRGKIIKGISGFYYVNTAESGMYACRAKGIFRNRNIKPYVGDDVEIEVLDEKDREGSLTEIYPRKNVLHRPAVANIDQALLIFAAASPKPDYSLLEHILVMLHRQDIPAVICFNKSDLAEPEACDAMRRVYQNCEIPVVFTSASERTGLADLLELMQNKTSAVAGPSGVGKSSIANCLQQNIQMETGAISRKIERGKNTTRHAQLIPVMEQTYLVDTPGFGSLALSGVSADELWKCYREFWPYEPDCRFYGCSHINEPDCGIKRALHEGKIHPKRYENYVSIYRELKEMERCEWRKS